MRRLNRSAVVRAAVVGIALILVVAAVAGLVAPKLINLAPLREQVTSQLSAQLGAKVDLASLHVSAFPLPQVVLDQVRLSMAPTLDATVESVSVYPRLWALLTGRIQLAQVTITDAHVQVHLLPGRSADEPAAGSDTVMGGLRETVAAALATLSSVAAAGAPGSTVRLTHGTVSVIAADGQAVTFTDIHGTIHLPPDRLSFDLASRSTMWEQATLSAAIDPASVRGDGHVTLTGIRPQVISRYLMPADLEIGNATANLDVRLTADGLDALRADVDATIPTLSLRRAAEHLTLEGARVKTSIKVDGQTVGVTINEVHLAVPPAQLSGTLVLDRTTPQVRLELEGRDLDVSAAHEVAVFFTPASPLTRTIFGILRAGRVSQLTLQAQGRAMGDLTGFDAMLIRGALVDGRVHVPKVDLDLDDVGGEVSIANGVLVGEHVAGRLGNTRASDGSVRIGLAGESRELSVTAAVQADASGLPAGLKRVVANEILNRTLDRLTDVRGRVEGQLMLSGSTNAVTTAVDVSKLSVSFKERNLSQLLQIEGGKLHYDARGIAATDLKVTTGKSAVSELSARVDMSATPPSLDVTGARGRIALAEIYPWLAASGWLPDSAWTPKALMGTLAVESVRVRGPAGTPDAWRVEFAGSAQSLDVDSPRLRQTTAVRFPLSLANLRLTRKPAATALSTRVATRDGLNGMVDIVWNAAGLNVKRLSIRDAQSNAFASLLLKEHGFDLMFAGNLETATLEALVPDEHHVAKSLRGNFRASIFIDQPTRSTAEGHLEVNHISFPALGTVGLSVERADLKADGTLLAIDAEADVDASIHVHLHGAMRAAVDAFIADLDLSAGQVDWARLEPLLPPAVPDRQTAPMPSAPLPLRGRLGVTAESFTYGGYTWHPVRAVVDLSGGSPSITVTQSTLCGIATPGKITQTPDGLSLQFKALAKNQPLDQMLACLFDKPGRMTGRGSLSAQVDASGRGSEIGTSAHGHVQMTATSGRLYRGGMIEKILSVMSVANGSLSMLSDLTDDGLIYNTIDVKGDLLDGKLVLTEATLDAPSMKMVVEGAVDVRGGTLDLTLLVAPLKSVDTIVSRIPIIGDVLGGSLVTIPIKVTGLMGDPAVTPLSPSEIGSGLLRVMKRIVKQPLRLLQPISPGDRVEGDEQHR